MSKIYIHNPVISKFGKSELSILELSTQTALKTLNGFETSKLDFLIFSTLCPEIYTGEFNLATKIANALHLNHIFSIRSETASSSGASAIQLATFLIKSGNFKNGLVIGSEIMSRLGREPNNILLGSVLSNRQISLAMTMSHCGALITQRYFHEYGYSKKDLFHLAKKLHKNGFNNPNAHIKKLITFEDYEKAPIFSSPLGLYDISPISDGSASLIISSEIPSNTIIRGLGHGTDGFYSQSMETSFPASISAFRKVFEDARLKPYDIKVAELHDAFITFELIGAEDSGLIPRGKALSYVIEGVTDPNGKLPINPSGGLKSRGHPIGASGLAQIVEISNFMQNNPNYNIGLTHSIGGLATNNFACILERIN